MAWAGSLLLRDRFCRYCPGASSEALYVKCKAAEAPAGRTPCIRKTISSASWD